MACDLKRPTARRTLVCVILGAHVLLLAWSAWRYSPVWDEVGHLPAGVSHLKFGRFDLYRVNPPLVRTLAALPVLCTDPSFDWRVWSTGPSARSEFAIGFRFLRDNGTACFGLFSMARWALIPFSILGAIVCYLWGRDLYGESAGTLALLLWCFSPNVLAHGALMTPDAGAAALGGAANYVFWKWLRTPGWRLALSAGLLLGLAELTKTTWVVLYVLWPLLWLVRRWFPGDVRPRRGWRHEAVQGCAIMLVAVYVVNAGYGYDGSLEPLGKYKFVSTVLKGDARATPGNESSGNRFAETPWANVPVPLPREYVLGIDCQKHEFEKMDWSYLRGEWQVGGWWYYYLYALAIKVPLGSWGLLILASVLSSLRLGYSSSWRDELVLVAPAIVVLTLVSSHTGFNHHLRYVLPVLPFAFVWMSKVGRAVDLRHWSIVVIATAALAWAITSSLLVYPHSLSYFNELVGGPTAGHAHLHNSNTDWGQDRRYLEEWLDRHPEVDSLGHAGFVPLSKPTNAGVESELPPQHAPEPGWFAVSVNRIRARGEEYAYFLQFEPVAMAGYTIYIYQITLEEANRVRLELGAAELPVSAHEEKSAVDG
jgi:dolichyl-phosphate-mannose-protein mannosyltransferase